MSISLFVVELVLFVGFDCDCKQNWDFILTDQIVLVQDTLTFEHVVGRYELVNAHLSYTLAYSATEQ